MKVKVEIDTDDLLLGMTRSETEAFADELIFRATDDAIVEEVIERDLMDGILDILGEGVLIALLEPYGFIKKEE